MQRIPPLEQAPDSVLVLKPSSLGDVVHTLPAVAALHRHWPGARIRWMVNPEWAPILQGNPALEQVLLFPRNRFRGPLGPLRLIQWARGFAREARSELVLDFQCLLRSGFIGRLCRGARFYGLSDAREGAGFFYDGAARVTRTQHAVDRYLALVGALGVPIPPALEWPLPGEAAPDGFDAHTPFVVLHPFSRGNGKSLTPAEVQSFCRALAPLRVVLLGRSDAVLELPGNVENLLNQTTLPGLIAIMRRAAWIVSVDSGPMHIAAAITPRVTSIHTWSDPQRVGPYRRDAWVWREGRIFQRGNPDASLEAAGMEALARWVQTHALSQP